MTDGISRSEPFRQAGKTPLRSRFLRSRSGPPVSKGPDEQSAAYVAWAAV
jgi:hypothetical protein